MLADQVQYQVRYPGINQPHPRCDSSNMFRFFVIAVCAFAVVYCTPGKRRTDSDYEVSETGHYEVFDDPHGGGIGGKGGFSAGSGLKAIAQGSAEQANNAVVNQHTAGRQAAFIAKSTLAQTAIGASATAQAALVGKQILVQRLEQELNEAQQALEAEGQQLEQAQRAAAAAQETSQQAQQQMNALNAAMNAAQGTITHARQAAEESTAELGTQSAMVGKAKQRLSSLSEQLHAAKIDFQATQAAAKQAEAAAQIAQSNAASAAASASEQSSHDIGSSHGIDLFDGYHH